MCGSQRSIDPPERVFGFDDDPSDPAGSFVVFDRFDLELALFAIWFLDLEHEPQPEHYAHYVTNAVLLKRTAVNLEAPQVLAVSALERLAYAFLPTSLALLCHVTSPA